MIASSDSLALPKQQADPIWREMNNRVDIVAENELEAREYGTLAQLIDAPEAFTNLGLFQRA